uniref:Large ribosomal subunit protein bL34c n=1 Tax=Astrosyne radiata TaxID=1158023 RepID=A0A2U9NTB7_9STRA|nr:ribosomal protein L34 [Astrosyne radiata]AWT40383.1 ribosomal protein L34 [Astrosyne radiata]
MTKRTLSRKSRYAVKRTSGFLIRMATHRGRKIISNRRKKKRKNLALFK